MLTAAHCLTGTNADGTPYDPSDLSIVAGTDNPALVGIGQELRMETFFIHPDYDLTNFLHDIALVKLNGKLQFNDKVQPIGIVSKQNEALGAISPGTIGKASGWGETTVIPSPYPSSLQIVDLPIVSNDEANAGIPNYANDFNLVAGFTTGEGSVYFGDSGGPFTVQQNGIQKLAGVNAFALGDASYYSGFEKVSAYQELINHVIRENTEGDFMQIGDEPSCQDAPDYLWKNNRTQEEVYGFNANSSGKYSIILSFDDNLNTISGLGFRFLLSKSPIFTDTLAYELTGRFGEFEQGVSFNLDESGKYFLKIKPVSNDFHLSEQSRLLFNNKKN